MFGLLTDEANIELDHIQQLTTLNCDVCSNSGALEGVQSFTYLYTEFLTRSLHKNHNATIFKLYDDTTKAS